MFGRRDIDLNPRRFWSWFAPEAQGIANALEALQRGEADAEWALAGLNARIRRFDSTLEADVVRALDGSCHMTISGADAAVDALLHHAPTIPGWRFSPRHALADTRRVPFRTAPRPSMDVLGLISARHEAYAL
jgi:hypothetical protein